MGYKEVSLHDQRLVILRHLVDANGSANDSVLNKVLDSYGHKISRQQVKTHLFWLEEQNLVEIDSVMSTDVATITSHGVDVAQGRARVPGVGVPRLGA